ADRRLGAERQRPELAPGHAIVGGEVEEVAHDGEISGRGRGSMGGDVLHHARPASAAIRDPELAAGEDVVSGEVQLALGDDQLARVAGDRPQPDVANQYRAGGGAVSSPELDAVRAVVGGEVEMAAKGGRRPRPGDRPQHGDLLRGSGSALRAPESRHAVFRAQEEKRAALFVQPAQAVIPIRVAVLRAGNRQDGACRRPVRAPDAMVAGEIDETPGARELGILHELADRLVGETSRSSRGAIAPPDLQIRRWGPKVELPTECGGAHARSHAGRQIEGSRGAGGRAVAAPETGILWPAATREVQKTRSA